MATLVGSADIGNSLLLCLWFQRKGDVVKNWKYRVMFFFKVHYTDWELMMGNMYIVTKATLLKTYCWSFHRLPESCPVQALCLHNDDHNYIAMSISGPRLPLATVAIKKLWLWKQGLLDRQHPGTEERRQCSMEEVSQVFLNQFIDSSRRDVGGWWRRGEIWCCCWRHTSTVLKQGSV